MTRFNATYFWVLVLCILSEPSIHSLPANLPIADAEETVLAGNVRIPHSEPDNDAHCDLLDRFSRLVSFPKQHPRSELTSLIQLAFDHVSTNILSRLLLFHL